VSQKEKWELIKNARDQGKLNVINAMPAVRELMKQVEFQYKVLNRIESSFDFRKENNLALTQVIIDKLQMFEKDGFISVHSNPKEILDLEKLKRFEEKKKQETNEEEEELENDTEYAEQETGESYEGRDDEEENPGIDRRWEGKDSKPESH